MTTYPIAKGLLFRFLYVGLPPLLLLTSLCLAYEAFNLPSFSVDAALGFVAVALVGLVTFLLMFRWNSAYYTLDEQDFKYSFGLREVTIPVATITAVQTSTYPAAGVRASLAWHGLMIHHGAGYQLFISPEAPENFIRELRRGNPDISVG